VNGEQGSPPRRSGAGGIVGLVLVVLVVAGFVAAHAARSVQVTTCTTGIYAQCTVQTVPVTTTGP
jgi:hypothetical protein